MLERMEGMNNVELTDDELSVIMTALQYTIQGFESFVEKNGKDKLDSNTIEAIEETKTLYKKIESKYY